MRFVLTPPSKTRPSMVVYTCDGINDVEIRRLRDDMFGVGCANGLLFDRERCVIFRDTFSSMTPESIAIEGDSASTQAVLANAGAGPLDARVGRWLEMLSSNWNTALPFDLHIHFWLS